MKVIFMAHPVAGAVEENLAHARLWVKWIEDTFHVAVCSTWITECEIYDDSNPKQRETSFKRNFTMMERCDELWLVGTHVSGGMAEEREFAKGIGLPVIDFTVLERKKPPESISEIRSLDAYLSLCPLIDPR